MQRFLIALALATACGGPRNAPPVANDRETDAVAGECSQAAAAYAKTLRPKKGAKVEPGKLEGIIAKHCVDDEWNKALRTCMASSGGEAAPGKPRPVCAERHQTQDQQEKLAAAVGPFVESIFEELMADMRRFADSMCACKDAKCAQGVSDELTKWSQELAKRMPEPPQMTEADQKRAAELGEKMGKCMQVAMTPAPAPLQLSSIDPASGDPKGGTQVKIIGTGFLGDGGRKAKVYFGAKEGKFLRFEGDTELYVETPAGKAKDKVDVRVVFDPGGEMTLPKAYTFAKKK